MKTLVLNDFFVSWSGSEVVALEVAEHFNAVTSSFYVSEPLLSALPSWCPLDDVSLSEFDLVWAQQHTIIPLINRLKDGNRRPFIAMVSLSPYEPNEQILSNILDSYSDLLIVNSEETAAKLSSNAMNFKNAAPLAFHFDREATPLKYILVVSNHVPRELLAALKILRREGISSNIIGINHDSRRVTPSDIKKADLVITIGKTVRYALASGTPVYVYDRFGGDGYIDESNYLLNEAYNFSGRPNKRLLSASEIASEIVSGYKWSRLPRQPNLEEILDSIQIHVHAFERHPHLESSAAIATALGQWLVTTQTILSGEHLTWKWLLHALWIKILRSPKEFRKKLWLTKQ